jgi:3-oxoacyl-(acyl-carrier-protein) synthase
MAMEKKRSEMEQVDYEPRLFDQVGERYMLKIKRCLCIEKLPDSGVIIRDKIDSITSEASTDCSFPAPSSGDCAVAVTGVSAGLPSRDRRAGGHFSSTENLDRLLDGENFISPLSPEEKSRILALNVTRMARSEQGGRAEKVLDHDADVMQVASFSGPLNLEKECGLPEHISSAMDTVCQMAIAVGLDALRHAECVDVTGHLHKSMQDSTGIIFASSFSGLDSTVDAVTRSIRDGVEYRMDRKLLFKLLVKANSQLAVRVKARGPNTSINCACAGTTQALAIAEDWIRLGRCDRVVVLGADNPTSATSLPWIGAGFLSLGAASNAPTVEQAAKPFDRQRSGLVLGSAAVAIVVEREDVANARRRLPLARALCMAHWH